MAVVATVLYFVVLAFFVCLIVRLILDWVSVLSRTFRPRGIVLVVAEAVYTVTDPPLKGLRRLIPPINLGAVQLDIGFMILFFGCSILMGILRSVAM